MSELNQTDPDVYNAIKGEEERELSKIVLIASENYVSNAVLEAQGSVFTNTRKAIPTVATTAGVSSRSRVSRLAMSGLKQLFGAKHVNVQPHSGSSANMAVYFSVLASRETRLGVRGPPRWTSNPRASATSRANFTGLFLTAWTRNRNS